MVLSRGRALYSGAGGLAPAEYFASRGQAPPPEGYNIAEHLLDIASEEQVGSFSASGSITEKDVAPATPANGTEKTSTDAGMPLSVLHEGEAAGSALPRRRYATTFLTQFEVLAGREWKNYRLRVLLRPRVICHQPSLQTQQRPRSISLLLRNRGRPDNTGGQVSIEEAPDHHRR